MHKENNLSNPNNPIKLIPLIKLIPHNLQTISKTLLCLPTQIFSNNQQLAGASPETNKQATTSFFKHIHMEMEKQVTYENDDLHLNLRLGLPGSDDTENKTSGTKRASSQMEITEKDDQDSSPPPSK